MGVTTDFKIPKQTDRQLITALIEIQKGMSSLRGFTISILPCHGANQIDLQEKPHTDKRIEYVLSEESEIMPDLYLKDSSVNLMALCIHRTKELLDKVNIEESWLQKAAGEKRDQIVVKLLALSRKHLRVTDTEASMSGGTDTEWTRYRDAQQHILQSLEKTQTTILEEFARKSIQQENELKERISKQEAELQSKFNTQAERLQAEHDKKLQLIEEREVKLKEREESFNTKEARYEGRKQQQDQLQQITNWTNNWSLTKGTSRKRWPVTAAYLVGCLSMAVLTGYFSDQMFTALSGKELSSIP